MTESRQDRVPGAAGSTTKGLVNYEEELDVEAHLTALQARLSSLEQAQLETHELILLNRDSMKDLLGWFQEFRKSLKILMVVGNMLVWMSKVITAFVILYGIAIGMSEGRFPYISGFKFTDRH